MLCNATHVSNLSWGSRQGLIFWGWVHAEARRPGRLAIPFFAFFAPLREYSESETPRLGRCLRVSAFGTPRGCEEIEQSDVAKQPLTPSLSRRERVIERRNLNVYLQLNAENALERRTVRPPSPPGRRSVRARPPDARPPSLLLTSSHYS